LSDVFEEVEESLRQDKASALWRKYGWVVIGLAALIVIATLVFNLVGYFREQAEDARTRQFEAARTALNEADYTAAIEGLEPLAMSEEAIAPLAASYMARARIEGEGDVEAAAAALERAMATGDEVMSDISRVKLAYLRADTMTLEELEALLDPLMKRDNAMEAVALEIIAAKAYAVGDYTRARAEYGFLKISPNAPGGVKQRAENALLVIPRGAPADSDSAETGPDAEAAPDEEEAGAAGPDATEDATETDTPAEEAQP